MQAVREPEFDLVQAFCSSCTAKLSLGEEEATEKKKSLLCMMMGEKRRVTEGQAHQSPASPIHCPVTE